MNKVQLGPFGSIERFQRPRRLGKKEPNLRSSVVTRWETIAQEFDAVLQTAPELKDRLNEAIQQRDKEIIISRGEYDQLAEFLDRLNDAWSAYIDATKPSLKEKIVAWQKGSRRGYFRLVLLLILLGLEDSHARESKRLDAKGLGGLMKGKLETISGRAIEAKAGSLYVALDDFERESLIVNYKAVVERNAPVSVTDRGCAFVIDALKAVEGCLQLLEKTGIFLVLKQDNLDDAKGLVESLIDKKLPDIDIGAISREVSSLATVIESIKDSSRFEGVKNENVTDIKEMIDAWQDNINRGIIDIYILGRFFAGPCYGNSLITDAETSLGFQAGTLYPKVKDLVDKRFIVKVTDDDQVTALSNATLKKQGRQKNFYDITVLGALFFTSLVAMFIVDLKVLFNLAHELLDRVNPPLQKS